MGRRVLNLCRNLVSVPDVSGDHVSVECVPLLSVRAQTNSWTTATTADSSIQQEATLFLHHLCDHSVSDLKMHPSMGFNHEGATAKTSQPSVRQEGLMGSVATIPTYGALGSKYQLQEYTNLVMFASRMYVRRDTECRLLMPNGPSCRRTR